MTSPFVRFPDVQRTLANYLTGVAGVAGAGSETPTDWTGQLPFVRVLRTGGSSSQFEDFATVDVDVFAELYTVGQDLTELLKQLLVGPPPPIATLDKIICEAGPRELPWGDGLIRRFNLTFTVVSRRRLI